MWRWVVVFADGYTYLNHPANEPSRAASIGRVAVAVDPYPEGPKRAVLGAAIAHAAGAEPTLLAVEPDLPLIIPGQDRKPIHEETKAMLRGTRKLGVLLTRE